MQTVDEISEVINSIRQVSGVGVCYYDLENFFNYGMMGVKNNIGHYCEFCEKARGLKNGRDNCTKSDRVTAVTLAKEYKAPFFFRCYMGMQELVVPLFKNELLLGVLFVGQCRIKGEEDRKGMGQAVKQAGGSVEEFCQAYDKLNAIKREDMVAVGKILQRYFDVKIFNDQFIDHSLQSESAPLVEKVKHYVDNCYTLPITPQSIAERFFANPSYVSRVFSNTYSITLTDYLITKRIEKAKTLLVTTSAPIGNIALNCGFSDLNYFSRTFKKRELKTPIQYRNENK
jgi:AraC-like DNA-binding protein